MSFIKDIVRFVNQLEVEVDDLEKDEFIIAYNDGDIYDWHTTHFDDSVSLGIEYGDYDAKATLLERLKTIIENNS